MIQVDSVYFRPFTDAGPERTAVANAGGAAGMDEILDPTYHDQISLVSCQPDFKDHAEEDDLGEFDETSAASFVAESHFDGEVSENDASLNSSSQKVDCIHKCDKSTSDSADDRVANSSDKKDAWIQRWHKFISDRERNRDLELESFVVSGREIDIFELYRIVTSHGGLDKVIELKKMAQVAVDLGFLRSTDLR